MRWRSGRWTGGRRVKSRHWVSEEVSVWKAAVTLGFCFFFLTLQQKLDAKQSHHITYTARLVVHFYFCLRVWSVDSGGPTHLSSHTRARARGRSLSACEGWLSRWCITDRSASASSLRGPLRQSASANRSVSQRPNDVIGCWLASSSTNNCHE